MGGGAPEQEAGVESCIKKELRKVECEIRYPKTHWFL